MRRPTRRPRDGPAFEQEQDLNENAIQLRGVEVHNLKKVDLDLPLQELTVVCGVSGSGKTSLALDTLYAEGQRRYIESFSAYTRQFLSRLSKPAAERIEGIPPAIAVTHKETNSSNRATVGTATEILDYLRLLYSRVGKTFCPKCHGRLRQVTVDQAAGILGGLPERTRFMVAFPSAWTDSTRFDEWNAELRLDGFMRWISRDRIWNVDDLIRNRDGAGPLEATHGEFELAQAAQRRDVVVDRLTATGVETPRLRDSLETAFEKGVGRCAVYVPLDAAAALSRKLGLPGEFGNSFEQVELDGQSWNRVRFSSRWECTQCDLELPKPDPRLFSFNSPLGACPDCEGFGNIMDIDMDLVVPDHSKSLRKGAIAPWNTPAYRHELEELLELAADYQIPVDAPYRELDARQRQLIWDGVPERNFGGLQGFINWLERRKYKMHIRVFLGRWRNHRSCPTCQGARLRAEALATRVADRNIYQLCGMSVDQLCVTFADLLNQCNGDPAARLLYEQIQTRLKYLGDVGLGYLTLDRCMRTLSAGESQRVALTSALGSNLVNMLYVLDEPSMGLHAEDMGPLVESIRQLRNRGNTVVVVEHEATLIRAADHVVEIGPGAGEEGGRVTFHGTPERLCQTTGVLTGDYLAGRRGRLIPDRRRKAEHGWIKLTGARGNNLQNLTVEFPLGVLCVVTGVSGSGKSTLVERTLYPALARRKGKEGVKPLAFEQVVGDGQLEDVVLIDQSAIGRSPRSNPVTYIKAFDAIRAIFAETLEARTRNLKASQFSFNVDGGRCPACKGDGIVAVDMQFLADVRMECSECQGKRYRRQILNILYRGKSIADILEMTVRRAHSFFRGQAKVQNRLQQLIDVGLDYLRLGQAANTLSAGEAQRLKLAGFLASPRKGRTLFIMDEPTVGLHFADVVQLIDCFESLLALGHSLIIVEHDLQVIQSADYLIDLGPGAAERGGRVMAMGTPDQVARCQDSATGKVLRGEMDQHA